MAKETRRDIAVRKAREDFCVRRRDPDRFVRWVQWYHLRSLLERWDDDEQGRDITGANQILAEAEAWRRGFRPPTSFHEANGRIRERLRARALRGLGVGL